MFITLMISWWYGSGFKWVFEGTLKRIDNINEAFSVGILLKTLFAPWKQIQTPQTFQNFLQSSVDNFISRFIGATVRSAMLFAAFCSISFVIIFGLVILIIWPFVPLLIIGLPVMTLFRIFE